jgi:hypothetical protein
VLQSCFFPECGANHIFPQEFAVNYVFLPECPTSHVFPT